MLRNLSQTFPAELPRHLTLELTTDCNYACPYCYCLWHEFPELAHTRLSADQWKELISFAAERNVKDFLFTGGEALLFPGLRALISFARNKIPEGTLSLFTNGSLMTEEFFFFCKENKVKLATSLQGLRSYGAMTGTDRTFHTLLELLAFGRQNNWKLDVSMTVTQKNMYEICDMFAAAALSGAGSIQLGAMMPEGRGKKHLELTLNRNEWETVKENIRKMKNCGVPYSFCDEMLCECRVQPPELIKRFGDPEFKPCAAGKEFGVIGPDGTYRKCLHHWEQGSCR